MKISLTTVWALPLLALAACEDEAPTTVASETGGEAAGEVLGGTISDDMIPLEELTSTSPPAERSPGSSDGASGSGAPSAPAETAPAQEPTGPITAGPARPEPETAQDDVQ